MTARNCIDALKQGRDPTSGRILKVLPMVPRDRGLVLLWSLDLALETGSYKQSYISPHVSPQTTVPWMAQLQAFYLHNFSMVRLLEEEAGREGADAAINDEIGQ